MSRVVVVFTGGTITMRHDPAAGGLVPVHRGAEILARTSGLERIAGIETVDWGLIPASHLSFTQLIDLAATARRALERSDVDGAVVVQGTDNIEETSFALDLLLDSPKPVAVTGAMRSAGDDGYDGSANLRDAVRCAASPELREQGVVVTLAGSIHAADDVTKTHTDAYTAFQSLNLGPLGSIDGERVLVTRRRTSRRHVAAERAAEPVHLFTAVLGMDGALVRAAVAAGTRGLVFEATGSGNTQPSLLEAASEAMAAGIPVVVTTRCPSGRARPAYAFPGGGATWARAGAIFAGFLGGPKARIALALGLGAGLGDAGLRALFAD